MEDWQSRWKERPQIRTAMHNRVRSYTWIGGMTERHGRVLITADVCESDPIGQVIVWWGSGIYTHDGVEGIYSSMDEADTAVTAVLILTALV